MPPHPECLRSTVLVCHRENGLSVSRRSSHQVKRGLVLDAFILVALVVPAQAVICGAIGRNLVHESGIGSDILGGPVKRNDASTIPSISNSTWTRCRT